MIESEQEIQPSKGLYTQENLTSVVRRYLVTLQSNFLSGERIDSKR